MSAPRNGGWGALRRAFRLPGSPRRVERDVQDELRFHIEERIAELVELGHSRTDAERLARERFGDIARYSREASMIDKGIVRRRGFADLARALGRDAAYAARGLARRPLFSSVVVLTLALGIGANTAVFSVVEAVLLRPLPVRDIDRLAVVYDEMPGINLTKDQISPPDAKDLIARTDLFTRAAAFGGGASTVTGIGEPRMVSEVLTIGPFFDVFGLQPYLGRFYRPEDSEPGRDKVVVLTFALWQELTGGDQTIIGRTLELSGERYQVLGVLAPDFRYPRRAELFRPHIVTPQLMSDDRRGQLYLTFVGRLAPGVSLETLAARLRDMADQWNRAKLYHPRYRFSMSTEPLVQALAGQLRPVLFVLMGAVVFVLLIACANVGSLQLVRATGRTKEMGVRVALGASRWTVARQLLVESLMLALAGGALGLAAGAAALRILVASDSLQIPALRAVHLDGTVLAFTAIVTIAAALLFGTLPALRAASVDPHEALKDSSRGSSGGRRRHRALQGSVVVQVALTLVLLLGSAVTIESLSKLLATDPGFRAEQVMTVRVSAEGRRYENQALRSIFFTQLLERMRGQGGVASIGMVWGLPFGEGGTSSPFEIGGMAKGPNDPERHASMLAVGGDYFRTMGIPLLRGRAFDDSDRAPPPFPRNGEEPSPAAKAFRSSLIIDDALAKKYFGDRDPIGREISQGPPGVVVGVVGSVRREELGQAAYPTIYYVQRQFGWIGGYTLVIRSALDPAALTALVRKTARELDPTVPVYDALPMRARIDRSLGTRRLAMSVLSGFAALSLILALLGVYGVISYGVSQRTQEIGIRMALGARPGDVTRMVLRGGLSLALMGAAIGVLLFLGVGGAISSLVYGVGPRDPTIIVGGTLLLAAVSSLASWWPARRAAGVSPVEALKGS